MRFDNTNLISSDSGVLADSARIVIFLKKSSNNDCIHGAGNHQRRRLRLKGRLELSKAKYRSPAGHARIARLVTSLVPFYQYDEAKIFKADSAPGPDAARHLRWLRDAIGNRFALGLVLHTGPRSFRLDESIAALPICALWG